MKSIQKILIGTLVLICSNTHHVWSQSTNLVSAKSDSIYFESPALFECKVQFPVNYNTEKSIPLIISLHGGGGSYESFKNIWKHFENPQFIMATPQAPYKWLMGNKIGYDWSAWPSENLITMQTALKLTSKYIQNLIKSLTTKFKINKVYLMGFSQGSIITQIAGIKNHKILDGLIILSGPEIDHPGKPEIIWPSAEAVKSASKLRVFIAHGKSDKIIDIALAKKSKEQYKKMGYDVSLFEFEGGHEVSERELKGVEKWINKE
jgi:phospholipase/carboxylesterase